eukprot:1743334-Prymnesium_polylepis.4
MAWVLLVFVAPPQPMVRQQHEDAVHKRHTTSTSRWRWSRGEPHTHRGNREWPPDLRARCVRAACPVRVVPQLRISCAAAHAGCRLERGWHRVEV